MRNLVAKHVDFLHTDTNKRFFRFDIEEWLKNLERQKSPCLMVEAPEGHYHTPGGDNYMETHNGAFTVFVRIIDVDDYEEVEEALDTAKGYMEDFIRRIRRDNRQENDITARIAERVDFDHPYHKVGPVNNWVGWRCSIILMDNFHAGYNQSADKFSDS